MQQTYHLGSADLPERYSCLIPEPTLNGELSETDTKVNDSILYLSKEGVIRLVEIEGIRLIRKVEKMTFFNSTFKNCTFTREFCENVKFDSCLFDECKFDSCDVDAVECIFYCTTILSCDVDPFVSVFRECVLDDNHFTEHGVSCTFTRNLWITQSSVVREISNVFKFPISVYRNFIRIGSHEFKLSKEGIPEFDFEKLNKIEKQVVVLYDQIIRLVIEEFCHIYIASPLYFDRK